MAAKKTGKTVKKAAAKPAQKPAAKSKRKAASKRPQAKRAARKRVSAVPKGFTTVTPYLIVRGAGRALDFYTKAFGAKEKVRMAMSSGVVMHAEMKVGDSMVMLSEENIEWGAKSPETLGGTCAQVMLYVKSVDAFVERAAAAGATVIMPAADMFWGDRFAKLVDPFGHQWSVATHIEDVSPREMRKRSAVWEKSMAQQGQSA
jgi:PhnB protein